LLEQSYGLCVYCNERRTVTVDHIEPLRRGGQHDIDNIAPACKSCNSSKHDTPLLVWLAKRALERAA
jgi:5-methylcytosine-specific restriction endonuclease McrA